MAGADMSKSKTADRRTPAVAADVNDDKAERQAIRNYRANLQVILDGWDAATNAQKFGWTKDLVQIVRRSLRFF